MAVNQPPGSVTAAVDKSLILQSIKERTQKLLVTTVEYAVPSLWTRLPRELALLILSMLDIHPLLIARSVCRAWQRLAADVRLLRCPLSLRVAYLLATFPHIRTIVVDRELGGLFLSANKDALWQELHRREVFIDVRELVHPPLETTTGLTLLPTLVRHMRKQNLWRYALVFEYLQFSLSDDLEHCGLQTAFDIHELPPHVDLHHAHSDLTIHFQAHKTSRYLLTILPVVLMRVDKPVEALEVSDLWIKSQPECISAYVSRGRVLGWMKRYHEAIAILTTALNLVKGKHLPVEAFLLDDRAMAYSLLSLYDESIRDYERSIALNPNEPGIYVDYGYTLYNVGRLDDAVESATRSIEIMHLSTSYNMRGWARLQQERYQEAMQDFAEALADEAFLPIPVYGQAEVHFHSGRYVEAVELSTRVIDNKGPPLTSALWIRAMSLRALGRAEASEKDLEHLLTLVPHYSYERVARALVHSERGELPQALTLLDEAIFIQPGNWRYRVVRGNLLAKRLGRWSDALVDWKRAVQLHPPARAKIAEEDWEEAMRVEQQKKASVDDE